MHHSYDVNDFLYDSDMNADSNQLWFVGNARRTMCEKAVSNAAAGDFLIRKSRGSDMYALLSNVYLCPASHVFEGYASMQCDTVRQAPLQNS